GSILALNHQRITFTGCVWRRIEEPPRPGIAVPRGALHVLHASETELRGEAGVGIEDHPLVAGILVDGEQLWRCVDILAQVDPHARTSPILRFLSTHGRLP